MEIQTIQIKKTYRGLQQHLDRFPVGFPATESGIEIRILELLFSPEEAIIAMCLNLVPITTKKALSRIKRKGLKNFSESTLELKLDDLCDRGLITKDISGEKPKYSGAQFIVGIFEFQVNKLTKEFVRYLHQYFDEAFCDEFFYKSMAQLRTIPHRKAVLPEINIALYDDIRKYVIDEKALNLGVINCVCKQGEALIDKPCKITPDNIETCLLLGSAAKGAIDKGIARELTKEEFLGLLDWGEKKGLVLQPGNYQKPIFVCMCCGCCCGVLSNAKKFERVADFIPSNYSASIDSELCVECGTCETRCQVNAISSNGHSYHVNLARCIGCGLCVTTCSSGALSLNKREKIHIPPENSLALYKEMLLNKYGKSKTVLYMLKSRFGF